MRIFVAGASGVLGRGFVPLALAAGHEVVGMTRSERGVRALRTLGATPVVADALDAGAVREGVGWAAPEVVVNLLTDLGAGTSASNARLRVEGSRNLVDAARSVGVERIVTESISWVYRPGTTPAVESDPLDVDADGPRRATVRAVQAMEETARAIPAAVALRFGQLYGPGTWYAADGRFAALARAGELPASETVTSFVHVDDAARATLAALGWPAGVVNVVDDEPAPGTDWVPAFARAVGGPTPPRVPSADPGRPVDNGRARAAGWTPLHPTWRSGFAVSATGDRVR